jgi:hypothetical protein
MPVKVGRTYKHSDPAIERSLAELYQLIEKRKLDSDSIDVSELASVLNRQLGGLWRLLQLGKAFFRKVVIGPRRPVIARTGLYINNDNEELTHAIHLDLDAAGSAGAAIVVDMPGSPSMPVLQANTVLPTDDMIQFTGFASGTARLNSAGAWANASHSSGKRINGVRSAAELDRVLDGIDLYDWEPRQLPEGRLKHYTPMAEDFHRETGLGTDDSISALDVASLALAAAQRLKSRVAELEQRIAALEGA